MLMESIIEERSIYLNILNSIGNYILVLNSEGKLHYFNKPFKKIFGVFEDIPKDSHYSNWLRHNRQLVIDITSVFQNFEKKITRTAQRIYTQAVTSNFKDIKYIETIHVFNYTINSLNDISTSQTNGIIIILEDASALQELNNKYNAIQHQLMNLTNPVQTETSLQRCINKLKFIANSLDSSNDISSQLLEIINTLKEGNLNKTEILIPIELKSMENELKSRLTLYMEDNQPKPKESFKSSIVANRFNAELMSLDLEVQSIKN